MKDLQQYLLNEATTKNVSTIKSEDRDKSILNVKVNSFEEAVNIFAKYFGVKNYKIIDCKNTDKSFKQGPKYYTKDGYKVMKYVQFQIGKRDPSNVRFTITEHGIDDKKLTIQLIYYSNNKLTDYDWVYGLYDKNSYKYGQETLLDWIKGINKAKTSTNYEKYINY